jgi:hypothetical protein
MQPMTVRKTVRVADAALKLGIPTKEVLHRVDAGTLDAVKTAAGHIEILLEEDGQDAR